MLQPLIRGIPTINLDGRKSIELESDYSLSIILRQVDEGGNDDGAINLRSYDPGNDNAPTVSPNGGGYTCSFRERPGASTVLFGGSVTQNGVRASTFYTGNLAALDGDAITITYPDVGNPLIAPPSVVRAYTYRTGALTAPGDLRASGNRETDLQTLMRAINGTFDYGDPAIYHGTLPCKELVTVPGLTDQIFFIEARDGGVWGNTVEVASSSGNLTWNGSTLSNGSGLRGITLAIDHAVLPNSLIATNGLSRVISYDIMGLDSALPADPTKLVTGKATIYASNTVTP